MNDIPDNGDGWEEVPDFVTVAGGEIFSKRSIVRITHEARQHGNVAFLYLMSGAVHVLDDVEFATKKGMLMWRKV